MSLTKEELETHYRNESRAILKERLLLVLKAKGDGMIPALVAKGGCIEADHGHQIGLLDIVKKVLMD